MASLAILYQAWPNCRP